jgi:hypothetical protein
MMRRFPVLCIATLAAVGCTKSDEAASDTAAGGTATATAAPAAATLNLSDVAGRWNFRSVPEAGSDTTPTTGVLNAVGDTSAWTMNLPNRPPIKTRLVAIGGDSMVTETGPFQSVRRRGVQVTTTTVVRLQDGKLVGTTVARYRTTGADSVLRLRFEATKAP